MFNWSYRKVGGLHLFKLGRFTLSFAVSNEYRPIKGSRQWEAAR